MVRRWGISTAVMVVLVLALPVMGQDKDSTKSEKPWSFYKLSMTVREMDGTKTVSSRTYDFTQRNGEWGQLRVGSRIPVSTGAGNNSQFQYVDVGLNVDSRVQERDNDLGFDWRLNLSSAAADQNPTGQPVIRNVSSNGQTLLTLNKASVMTSVDDLNSAHKFVFEVTATKLK